MRADRLLSILLLLQTKGRMTAHDLADRLEVSERTIYRDLEALSMAGIPIYAERGPGGGCSLLDGYQTRLTGLTEEEVQALFLSIMAGPLVDLGLSRALEDALLKLSASLPATTRDQTEQMRQRVHLDATWWYHNDEQMSQLSMLQTIQQALWQDRKLCLVYLEDDGTWSEYIVEPYGLVAKAQVWYLVGRCAMVQWVFRISRMQKAEVTAETFMRSTEFNLASYWAEYCTQSEAAHARYAASMRLAPDEIPLLPQMWRTQASLPAEQASAINIPEVISFRQHKKGAPPVSYSEHSRSRARTLYVLNDADEWRPLGRSSREKRRLRSATKKTASPLAEKNAFLVAPIKKRISIVQGSIAGSPTHRPSKKTVIKKIALPLNKKKEFSSTIKKRPPFLCSAPLYRHTPSIMTPSLITA